MSVSPSFKMKIGDSMPSFKLKDIYGKEISEVDFKDKKILVLIFASNKCPVYRDYEDRIIQIQKDYGNKGVQVIAINSNAGYDESIEEMKKRAIAKSYNFPYLKDESQELAKQLGAICTPHVFVFDEKRQLRYQGRIDDNRNPSLVKSNDLRKALDSLLEGKDIQESITRPFGCSIVWKT
jgi:peroxiredoxin